MPPAYYDDGATSPLSRPLLSLQSTNPKNPPRPRSKSYLSGLTFKLPSVSIIINSHEPNTPVGTTSSPRAQTSTVLHTFDNLNPNTNEQSTPGTLPINLQSPRHSSSGGSYFASQPGASGLEARSPVHKRRPPASRSSHGIETSHGPPPALSTQRTYSTENAWRFQSPIDSFTFSTQLTPRTLATLNAENLTRRDTLDYVMQSSNISTDTEQKADSMKSVDTTPKVTDEETRETVAPSQNSRLLLVDEGTNHKIQSLKGAMIPHNASFSANNIRPSSQDEERLSQSSQEDLFHDTQSQYGQTGVVDKEDEEDRTIHGPSDSISRRKSPSSASDINRSSEIRERLSQSSQEDLFLDIANSDRASEEKADTPSPSERYLQSRSTNTNHRKSSPYNVSPSLKNMPSSDSRGHGQAQRTSLGYVPLAPAGAQQRAGQTPTSPPQTFHGARQYSSSAHPLDQRYRSRISNGTPRSTFSTSREVVNYESSPASSQSHVRRTSIAESAIGIPSRNRKLSNLSHATNGQHDPALLVARSISRTEQETSNITPRAEGTMSTVSTNAPSTVWDELDDLRSRIRRLELTGKMPDSSGAAISAATGERPATATTTMTTMSSSPKHDRDVTSVSPEASIIDVQDDSKAYKLMTEALEKSKTTISSALYKSLESTVVDAMEMTRITSNIPTTGTTPEAFSRQLRRTANNMRRSLTELCISLANKPEILYNTSTSRPSSSNNAQQQRMGSIDERRFQRDISLDADPDSTSRALNRLEARRSSMLGSSIPSPRTSIPARERILDLTTPTQEYPSPTFFSNRTSSALQRIRPPDSNSETPARPFSRPMTEVGSSRSASSSHRQLMSREYTSRRSPSVSSSLSRKSYFSALPEFSTTPQQANNRRYLERSTPLSADTAWAKDIRPRIASLGGCEGIEVRKQRAGSVGERVTERMRYRNLGQEKAEEKVEVKVEDEVKVKVEEKDG